MKDPILPDPAPAVPFPKDPSANRWQAGTLVYTSGGLVVLFCWLLWGDFSWAMKERSVQPVLQLLLKRYGASDMVNGLLIGALPNLIGILLGPVISYRSDRHRSRWGRRIPYLVVATPVAAFAIVGLAFSPEMGTWLHAVLGARSPGLDPVILIFFGVFWTLFEFATVAAQALFTGLINDVVPRSMLGRFYGLFRALNLIVAIMFNYWLFGLAEVHFGWMFIAIGVLYGFGFTLMCLKVKEGEYPPPPAPSASGGGGFFGAARTYLRECFSQPFYLWVFAAVTLGNLSYFSFNLFSVFYAKSVNIDIDTFGKYAALTYVISMVLSYFLGWLADRFHPLRVGMTALGLYALVTLWGGLYAKDATTFAIALVLHGVLAGTFLTGTASLTQRLFPHSRFAQFASAAALLLAIGSMLLSPLVGKLLDFTDHTYRYTLLVNCGVTVLALAAFAEVYRRFVRLGGPRNYVAPDDTEA